MNMATYAILDTLPIEGDDCWDDVVQTYATVRKAVIGTKCIVKWDGSRPASLPAGTDLTEAQVLSEIAANQSTWGEDA